MDFSVLAYALLCLGLILLFKYNWRRRWLYYYASKLPGPISLPIVGSVALVRGAQKDFFKKILQICESFPPVFRLWIGSDFYIVISEPKDVEIILTTFLDKSPFYAIWNDLLNNTILTAPASKWKGRRKMMNLSFSPNVLRSFHEIFVKYAQNIVKMLDNMCGKDLTNLMPEIWKHNIDTACETIADIDPTLIEDLYEKIPMITRAEKIIVKRFQKFWLLLDFFWNFSNLRKEVMFLVAQVHVLAEKAMKIKLKQMDTTLSDDDDYLRKKRFGNAMYNFFKNDKDIDLKEVKEETIMLIIAASETTSVAITSVILTLGLFPDIQDKIYQEISSVVGDNQGDFSLDDINRMVYLECVIKETLRLLPVAPIIMRSISKDTRLGPYTFPAGSSVMIPIANIHRRPDLWPNPLKFNPDRFLPEEMARRHRCAYIPFSYGTRNCIGLKYAMMSMKITLANIVKSFTIEALNYKSLEDVHIEYTILAQPVGYRVRFQKRAKTEI